MKTLKCFLVVLVALVFSSLSLAALDEDIEQSIKDGLDWLAANQNDDGSWSVDEGEWKKFKIGATGLVLTKMCDRAWEQGYSPFDKEYPYYDNVVKGFKYLFGKERAKIVDISIHPAANTHDVPGHGENKGIYFEGPAPRAHDSYNTGIVLMAIVSSRSPNRHVWEPSGSELYGMTYLQIAREVVDYLSYSQRDYPIAGRGGWSYVANQYTPDQSNTGYVVLGLAYAEHSYYGFNCPIPVFVKDELKHWIEYIQAPDGGSYYSSAYMPETNPYEHSTNVLRTGNLIFEMEFCGLSIDSQPYKDALEYLLVVNWNETSTYDEPGYGPGWCNPDYDIEYPNLSYEPHYQAMYCITKALDYAGIKTLPDGTDWYSELADAAVNTQQADGHWQNYYYLEGDDVLSTIWALLYLERFKEREAEHDIKWSQPPEKMDVYVGWDEESHNLLPRMVADDFPCDSNDPVTAIRWWGSFMDWRESRVPPKDELPYAFYITIWDDVPYPDPNNPNDFSHPGEIIWENYCYNYDVKFCGWEFDPRIDQIDLAKFVFYQEFDPNDYWYQPGDNEIYWLGIMALYCDCNADFNGDNYVDDVDVDMFLSCWGSPPVGGCEAMDLNCDGVIDDKDLNILCCQVDVGWPDPNCCNPYLWGWQTREHTFQDDAVRIETILSCPNDCPDPNLSEYLAGEPDDFNVANPEPAAVPLGVFSDWVDSCFGLPRDFDVGPRDRTFGHTFTDLPPCIVGAELEIHLKADSSGCDPSNDVIRLEYVGDGSTREFVWSRYIKELPVEPGGMLIEDWEYDYEDTFTLDLGHLLIGDSGDTMSILEHLADGALDICVEDDTRVDYIILRVWTCPLEPWLLGIGTVWGNGEPIEYPVGTSWDLSFELLTEPNEPEPQWRCAKADLYEDGVIDFKDYAVFSSCWLETWP